MMRSRILLEEAGWRSSLIPSSFNSGASIPTVLEIARDRIERMEKRFDDLAECLPRVHDDLVRKVKQELVEARQEIGASRVALEQLQGVVSKGELPPPPEPKFKKDDVVIAEGHRVLVMSKSYHEDGYWQYALSEDGTAVKALPHNPYKEDGLRMAPNP